MQSAEIRKESELPIKAILNPNCVTLAPPRNAPIESVVHWVVWVSELAVCSSSLVAIDGQNRRPPAGEERRSRHQQSAQQVDQPGLGTIDREDETERHHGAQQVARNHHALPVEAIEQHAGQRPCQNRGNRARQHHAGHHHTVVSLRQHQAKDGDVVEVIADLAHHLADPRIAVVVVPPQ